MTNIAKVSQYVIRTNDGGIEYSRDQNAICTDSNILFHNYASQMRKPQYATVGRSICVNAINTDHGAMLDRCVMLYPHAALNDTVRSYTRSCIDSDLRVNLRSFTDL